MRTNRALLLLLMVASLMLTGNCSRPQISSHNESAQPSGAPDISPEMLNRLLRQPPPKEQAAPASKTWAHKVRNRRETLFSIAMWYTGSGSNWPRLAEVNPDINPRRIHVGDTVLIPQDLLQTRDPMPAGFPEPERKRRKIKEAQPKSTRPPRKTEENTLFGPIENDIQPADPRNTELPVPLESIDQ
jgi:hypothetical protein